MATVSWHRPELTGVTLSLFLKSPTSSTVVNTGGDACTESSGLFTATVAESLTGWYFAELRESPYALADVVATGWVNMSASSPVVVETIFDGASIGTGARSVTITVNDGTTVLQGAQVRLASGAESFSAVTNSSGIATFSVNDATWTVAITKAGYSFASTSLVVDGTETQTYSMTALSITPSDPGQTTAYVTIRDMAGDPVQGATVQVQILRFATGTTGSGIDNPLISGTTDENGLVEFPNLPRSAKYQVRIGTDGDWFKGTTADATTTPLAGVLGIAE